jgi:NAD(P)-dependent dehydrogenase (short-subunit alcohol dehydrogenase family)
MYAASKAALAAYSKTVAVELADKKIRSNVIEAAMVRTPIFDQAEKEITPEAMEAHGRDYPLGFGETSDIANAVLFLLSPASRWITGTALTMDGGLTAGQ